jgi:hypothetical protein
LLGEAGIDALAEACVSAASPQDRGPQALFSSAALDADALLLVEVDRQAVKRPAPRGEPKPCEVNNLVAMTSVLVRTYRYPDAIADVSGTRAAYSGKKQV